MRIFRAKDKNMTLEELVTAEINFRESSGLTLCLRKEAKIKVRLFAFGGEKIPRTKTLHFR